MDSISGWLHTLDRGMGFSWPGIDLYEKTLNVPRQQLGRMMQDWHVGFMDVHRVFLPADLRELPPHVPAHS